MSERPPMPEKEVEKFPSKEEIQSIFEKFVKGREYKEVKFKADDKGVSAYEIETTDETGDLLVLLFQRVNYDYRDPELPPTTQFSASIHATFYSGDIPVSGECVANYLDGDWAYPPAVS